MAMISGRVCAHTHLYSGLVPLGMPAPAPPPQNFLQILQRVWWRLDRALDADILRASARLYVAEALLAGTTTLIDHHESPAFIEGSLDVLADVCEELGVRAMLCYGATERNGGREEAQRGLAACRALASRQSDRVKAMVALHASFTVSDDTIREAGELCVELDLPMHVHVAEDGADVEDAVRRGFVGPLERLDQLGALPAGSVLAHGIHLTPAQIALAHQRRWWFVHNPRSNEGNAVGYAASLACCERVGLGCDGYPARMAEEVAAAERIACEHGQDPALALQRLDAGQRLVAEHFGPVDDQLHERDGRVLMVRVGGQELVRDGVLLSGDLAQIRAEAARQAARLWARMAAIPAP